MVVLSEFIELCSMLNPIVIDPSSIGFRFNLNSNGIYTINTLRKKIVHSMTTYSGPTINWSKEIPLKVHCSLWRVVLGRLLVACNLASRGIIVQSSVCPM